MSQAEPPPLGVLQVVQVLRREAAQRAAARTRIATWRCWAPSISGTAVSSIGTWLVAALCRAASSVRKMPSR